MTRVGVLAVGFVGALVFAQCAKKSIELAHRSDDAGSSGEENDGGNANGGAPSIGGGAGRDDAGQGGGNQGGSSGSGNGSGGDVATGGDGGVGQGGIGGAGRQGTGGAVSGAGSGAIGGGGAGSGSGGTGGAGVGGVAQGGSGMNPCDAMGGFAGGLPPGCPACRAISTNSLQGCVLSEGMLVTTPMTETLTVVSVGDGSTLDCDGLRSSSTVDTRAIVLETVDLEHLTLLLRMPGLPDDALLVNDVVGMDLRASPGGPLFFPPTQTVVLTRNDELLLFVATDGFTATLAPHDIAMSDGGKMCGILGLPLACGFVDHRLRVRSGTSESTFEPGQTKQVGTLSVTLDQYNSREGGGGCDAAGSFRVGAFVP